MSRDGFPPQSWWSVILIFSQCTSVWGEKKDLFSHIKINTAHTTVENKDISSITRI